MRPEPSGRRGQVRPPVVPATGRGSVEDRLAHPTRALVLAVLDPLQGLQDVVVGPVLLRVLDDVLLLRRVVHAAEGLLDVDGAHHAGAGTPRGRRRFPEAAVTVGCMEAGTIVGLLAD